MGNVFNNTLQSFKGLSISSLASGSKHPVKQIVFGSTGGVCVIIKAMSRSLSRSVCNSHAVYGKILSSCHLMGGFYRLLSVPNVAVYILGFSCKRVSGLVSSRDDVTCGFCALWFMAPHKHMKSPACGFKHTQAFHIALQKLDLKGSLKAFSISWCLLPSSGWNINCTWGYSFSQSLWCISRIICKEVCAFLKTICTNSTTQWISCKSLLLTQNL